MVSLPFSSSIHSLTIPFAAENGELDGWALICPSGSPIRDVAPFDARKDDIIPPSDTFIQTHVSAMDVCLHPSQQSIHGFTAWYGSLPSLSSMLTCHTGPDQDQDYYTLFSHSPLPPSIPTS
jgi:hypothetical protein